MELNYWANVALTMHALPILKKSRGNILVVSSLAGKYAVPLRTGYSPTKFALHGFFNALRCEEFDIKITLVCPGFVLTEVHHRAFGVEPGHGDQRKTEEFMKAEEASHLTLLACARGDREYLMTFLGALGIYLVPYIPGILDKIAIYKNRNSFKEDAPVFQ